MPGTDGFAVCARIRALPEGSARTNRGLGLAFGRRAVEAHCGTISIEDGQPGAVFCVRIPRRHDGSEALRAEKLEGGPWLERMFRGYALSIDYRDRRGHASMHPASARGNSATRCTSEHGARCAEKLSNHGLHRRGSAQAARLRGSGFPPLFWRGTSGSQPLLGPPMSDEILPTPGELLPSLLLDTAPDAMVVVGPDSRIRFVNAQTEHLFGYRREQLLGQPLDILIPERLRERHAQHLQRFFANPGARPMGSGLELFGRCRDGRELPIEVSLSPLRTASGITVSASVRDISDRRQAEAQTRLEEERRSEELRHARLPPRLAALPRVSSCPR